MVVATALLGMVTMMLTTLNERRREMAILRSVGARPRTILGLLMAEAGVLTVLGIAARHRAPLCRPIDRRSLTSTGSTVCIWRSIRRGSDEWLTLGAIALAGCVAGLLPALRAYRLSLADGMTVRT